MMSSMQHAGLELSDQAAFDAPARAAPGATAMHRALQHRVSVLEDEQRRAASEYERCYARSGEILAEMEGRQQQLRQFREILLNWRLA